jgi:hypothetical protein
MRTQHGIPRGPCRNIEPQDKPSPDHARLRPVEVPSFEKRKIREKKKSLQLQQLLFFLAE